MKIKSIILVFLTMIVSNPLYSAETYNLQWKVKKGGYVAYKTSMDQIGNKDKNYLKFDLDKVFDGDNFPESLQDEIESLDFPTKTTATTIIKGISKDKLSFEMVVENMSFPQTGKSNKFEEFAKQFNGMVQLRGEINSKGEILSWYLEQRQKNLLAILVQLPHNDVSVGDTWELDFNLLSMGATFKAKKASRTNSAKLTSIEISSVGSKIAVIDYVLGESVDGYLFNPTSGKEIPISFSLSFIGRGKFDIEKGHWLSFNGRMHSKSKGLMSSEGQQQMSLQLVTDVPESILNAR